MRITRYIERVFWAAIVLIAVQLTPSLALAHDGHSHHGGVGAVAPITPSDRADNVQAGIPHDELRNVDHAGRHGNISGADICICTAGACSGNGMACCGALLATDQVGDPLPSLRAVRVVAPNPRDPSGIEPQALRKPPRSFA